MTTQEILIRLTSIAAEVFKVSPESIGADLKAGMIESWDSMGHLELFMAIESNWGLKFTTDEIVRLLSIKDIAENISEKIG